VKKTKKNKFNKIFFLLLIFVSLFFIKPLGMNAQSSDAIAVRIIENPLHYSSLRWYQSQNFAGSPQLIDVDGYEAVRNGRTVYINAANIIDQNNDGIPDYLFTNIYIISYNQDVQNATVDIFGQLLKNFKLNTNLSDSGVCSKSTAILCLTDDKCPTGEYCQSKKAKVIRDVKRLSDMAEIKSQLDTYKNNNNNIYPSLKAGSYIANKTISTWPSWQQNLGQELGASLPLDPINELGACPGYDPLTCWDKDNKKFATDLANSELPAGSHVYMYAGDNQGKMVKYCAQMESGFSNLSEFNCFSDKKDNRAPSIDEVNLNGQNREEFNGYVKVSDPDGDAVKLSLDLLSPSSDTWLSKKWVWDNGLNKFSVINTSDSGQKKIHALKTGNVGSAGYYKVRLTADDGQGAANSIYTHDYDINVNSSVMSLGNSNKTVVIGSSDSSTVNGFDGNGDPFTNLSFQSATFNNSPIDESALNNYGFILNGTSLTETFNSTQHTGSYIVNVYALDPNIPTNRINSHFTYTIVNNPPSFQKLIATFSNNTTQVCNPADQCSVSIDNAEPATVRIYGQDPDGQRISYSLVDNLGGNLTIDSSTGVISGFEKLNLHQLKDQTFNVSVKISDQYCKNSSDAECSSIYTFSVLVQKYCSVDSPGSTTQLNLAGPYKIAETGDYLDTSVDLNDCSAVGTSSVDVTYSGESHSQAIVLVSDLSSSMETNVGTSSAISQLRDALAADNTGFLDRLYNIISAWTLQYSVNLGLVAYNSTIVDSQSLMNLAFSNRLTYLKSIINSYSSGDGTNTLAGLNKAEEYLSTITDSSVEKIVILMSDGIPGVDGHKNDLYCFTPGCACGGTYPNCVPEPICPSNETYSQNSDGTCSACYVYKQPCYCGKDSSGNCNPFPPTCYTYGQTYWTSDWMVSCACVSETCEHFYDSCSHPLSPGDIPPNCSHPSCPNGYNTSTCQCNPSSAFNSFYQKIIAIFDIFKTNSAMAITNQTQCISNNCSNSVCPQGQITQYCDNSLVINCDLTPDVNTEATQLKNEGVSLYTIYYNTSNSSTPAVNMCNWSSNNGQSCANNTYAFAGTDISSMIDKVLGQVVTKPKQVYVGTSQITDSDMATTTSFVSGAAINSFTCGQIRSKVTYSNNGNLVFSNLKLNYCAKKLHS